MNKFKDKITKLNILSTIARIYDPMGLIDHVVHNENNYAKAMTKTSWMG
jgi:hypothetical protein